MKLKCDGKHSEVLHNERWNLSTITLLNQFIMAELTLSGGGWIFWLR